MLIFFRVLKESFGFAISSLRNNKLRTFLSLLGVTVGIFSIIAVLSAVDSLERKIKGDLSSLDYSTMYVKRFSFAPTDIPAWKREQFPDVTYDEFRRLRRDLPDVEAMSFQLYVRSETIKFESKSVLNVSVAPVSSEYVKIENIKLAEGRFFNESEGVSGSPVIVIGDEIANELFEGRGALGKQVRMAGRRFTVIGVLEKEGQGLFGGNKDQSVFYPVNFARRIYGDNNKAVTPVITVKPGDDVDSDELKAVIGQRLRAYRGVKAGEDDNFFIDQLQGFADFLDGIIAGLTGAGWIIAGFSLLVGGFGIANIMFVSVKERTNLIGIMKSLGAKARFILSQFLFEAILLSLFGGLAGLIGVYLVTLLVNANFGDSFEFVLSTENIILGSSVSAAIGLIAGFIPALNAAKLDPVEAIRTGM